MLKFYRKYELQWKICATIVWLFGAIERFFLRDDPEKKNFNLFGGIIFLILGIFYFFEVIELVKKERRLKGKNTLKEGK